MIGRIERIMENTAKNGNKYWLIAIEGKLFAAWKEELIKNLAQGDLVDITWQDFEGFKNVEKIVKVQNPNGIDNKTRHIIRMSCLRSAVELLSGLGMKRPSLKRVLKLAGMFETYVYGTSESANKSLG